MYLNVRVHARENETQELAEQKKKKVVVCDTGSSFTGGAQGPICPSRERRLRDEVWSPLPGLELRAVQEHPRWMSWGGG